MDRRAFLGLATVSAAGAVLAARTQVAEAASIPRIDSAQDEVLSIAATPQQYMVGGSMEACDWRYPNGDPVWTISEKDGAQWYVGELTEDGRDLILEHFGLDSISELLPLEKIRVTSPAALAQMRKRLEREIGMEVGADTLDMVSTRPGGHIHAEHCA